MVSATVGDLDGIAVARVNRGDCSHVYIHLPRFVVLRQEQSIICIYSHGDTDIIGIELLFLSCAAPVLYCHNCSRYGHLKCFATKTSLATSLWHVIQFLCASVAAPTLFQ